jgi:cyclohexanone monooxygenase
MADETGAATPNGPDGDAIPSPAAVVGHVDQGEQDAIRARYAAEKARRMRPDGTAQFTFLEGELEAFDRDPHTDGIAERDPVSEAVDVLVIGAGIGGIQAAVWLQKASVSDVRIVDVAGDFGGTWYWNRYPGLRCDTESYIYLPFLEETGFMPTDRYTTGHEILDYLSSVGHHFGLYDKALFHTGVTGMEWDEEAARWTVRTDRGDILRARFVLTQSGIFNRPQLPGVPGIADFEGHAFHTARWDYEYTGGSPSDPTLTGLKGKRVAVFGTGTTALQVIPEVARHAEHLTVFQRTPTSVNFRNNSATDPAWFRSLQPGWQQQRIEAFNSICSGLRVQDAPISDGWTKFFDYLAEAVERLPKEKQTPEEVERAVEAADFEWNNMLRARVDETVGDHAKADALKAYYRTLCKRLGFSDQFLDVFNRDNVDIVDIMKVTDLRVVDRGVSVDGELRPFDCIIFATGFEIGTTWVHQAKYDPVGRDGLKLSEAWKDGLRTYFGFHAEGFPNLLFMGMTQTATTLNVPHMLQQQVRHLSSLIAECLAGGVRSVEPTTDAVDRWQDVITEKNAQREAFLRSCTPSYLNNEGKPEDKRAALASGVYHPSFEFWELLAKWRAEGDRAGLRVVTDDAVNGSVANAGRE